MDKVGCYLDPMGHKKYSSISLEFKVSNHEVIMAGYYLFLWECILLFLELLPKDKASKVLQTETIHLSRQQINAGWRSMDTMA